MSSAAQHLSSKREVQSSIPGTKKDRQKERRKSQSEDPIHRLWGVALDKGRQEPTLRYRRWLDMGARKMGS